MLLPRAKAGGGSSGGGQGAGERRPLPGCPRAPSVSAERLARGRRESPPSAPGSRLLSSVVRSGIQGVWGEEESRGRERGTLWLGCLFGGVITETRYTPSFTRDPGSSSRSRHQLYNSPQKSVAATRAGDRVGQVKGTRGGRRDKQRKVKARNPWRPSEKSENVLRAREK